MTRLESGSKLGPGSESNFGQISGSGSKWQILCVYWCLGARAGGLGRGGDQDQVHQLQHVQLSHQEEQGAQPARRQVREVRSSLFNATQTSWMQ